MKTISITGTKKYIDSEIKRLDIEISSNDVKSDVLKRFWETYDYFNDLKIFDKFFSGSQQPQEIVRDYMEKTNLINYKDVGINTKMILDSTKANDIVNEYKDKDELKTKTDILLSLIAEKTLAIKNPEDLSFKGL